MLTSEAHHDFVTFMLTAMLIATPLIAIAVAWVCTDRNADLFMAEG